MLILVNIITLTEVSRCCRIIPLKAWVVGILEIRVFWENVNFYLWSDFGVLLEKLLQHSRLSYVHVCVGY